MELRTLRAFVEVARSGSFTQAAERLFVTQPTVSKLVRQLEEELGQTLLRRAGRHASPTDAGRLVLAHGETLLAQAAQMVTELSELDGLARGELRIGIPPLGGRVFVTMLGEFRRRHAGIELKLFEDGAKAIEAALLAGELELGGLLQPIDTTRFDCAPLAADQLVLVAPAWSAWGQRDTVQLAELADEPFILFAPGFALNDRIFDACRSLGFTPDVVGRSGQLGLILAMVRGGIGVALLPRSEVALAGRDGLAVCELGDIVIPWEIVLAWPREGYLSHAARAWLAMMRGR
ncbi:LysR family transcriptional regulator [Chitiniphilus shinanonensis]|uniref:LysR family transcriptional regulator n=1 Tax=Chitiniphilus shinanonensis TaxID=553088 RepID=UPI0030304874